MSKDIRDKQPALSVELDGKIHLISISDLRMLANSEAEPVLLRCLCKAIIEMSEVK